MAGTFCRNFICFDATNVALLLGYEFSRTFVAGGVVGKSTLDTSRAAAF
jgi:hypothetical protein